MMLLRLRFSSKTPEMEKSFKKKIFSESCRRLGNAPIFARERREFFRRSADFARPRNGIERKFRRAGFSARGGIAPPENLYRSPRGVLETRAANQKSPRGDFRAENFHRAIIYQRRLFRRRQNSERTRF